MKSLAAAADRDRTTERITRPLRTADMESKPAPGQQTGQAALDLERSDLRRNPTMAKTRRSGVSNVDSIDLTSARPLSD